MMFLYHLLFLLGAVGALPVLLPAAFCFRKRRKTVLQRLGLTEPPRAGSQTQGRIWVHALSVGEVISSVPLVAALRDAFPDREVVFSASTLTGFEIAQKELQGGIRTFFYFPYDLVFSVKRIIGAVNPDFLVIVETDLWPAFLAETERRQIPVFLVNSRLSERSFTGYRRFRFFFRPVFGRLTRICTQTRMDADRFRRLGIPGKKIEITGNVKFDHPMDRLSKTEVQQLRRELGIGPDRRVWVAGSTHEGEERVILGVFSRLKPSFEKLFLILAPRNPDRAEKVCGIAREFGFSASTLRMLKTDPSDSKPEVLAVDRIGLLKRLYALGEAAFVGGSLVREGGHNLLEPAAHGKPVIFGPHVAEFAEISRLLVKGGGAVQVADGEDLQKALAGLLSNPVRARKMGERGRKVFEQNRGSVERNLAVIRERMGL